jgi:acyl-CoA thioester hydrolase
MSVIVSETVRTCPHFYDLDPMGVVWHGNYPRFFELGRAALLTKIDYGYQAMQDSGFMWPVIDMHVRYYRPLKLGQWFDVTAAITEWENRLKIDYIARDATNGAKLTKGSSVHVAVDIETQEMQWQSPPVLRQKLAAWL